MGLKQQNGEEGRTNAVVRADAGERHAVGEGGEVRGERRGGGSGGGGGAAE